MDKKLKRLLLVLEMKIALLFAIPDVSRMLHFLQIWKEKKKIWNGVKRTNYLTDICTFMHLPVHGKEKSSLSISILPLDQGRGMKGAEIMLSLAPSDRPLLQIPFSCPPSLS